jgi:ribonucleotide reductase alpha subunit
MCPDTSIGLTDVYGEEYEKLYWSYVEEGKYKLKIKARDLMKSIIEAQLETGTPYMLYKDNINKKSNQKNIGIIKSSNLCVHEDTVILTDKGNINIKSLQDTEVNVWNGFEWSQVTVRKTNSNQNLIRVHLSNYSFIDCTPEHIFYIVEDFKICKVPASNLKINNKLIEFKMPNGIEIKDLHVTCIEESYKNVDTYCFTEPMRHMGVFNGILTGQCAEIVEYSNHEEYAVCNLASIAVNKCIKPFETDKEFIIITKEDCKYCIWAKKYLESKNLTFVEKQEKLVDLTYPQIYHDNKLIGGWNELYFYIKGSFDFDKLYDTSYKSAINLDKVIDVNYYPVPETQRSNMRHRPIAIGIQGLANALVLLKIPFDSEESLEFNEKMMETIYLASMSASCDISKSRQLDMQELINAKIVVPEYYDINFVLKNKELNKIYHKVKPCHWELKNNPTTYCGAYSSFEGSPISEGLFQFDLWNKVPKYYKEKWDLLREEVKEYGVRNSLTTALMPTASTSQILGNNECFEPFTSNIYTRRVLAGDFPLVNNHLIDELLCLNLWDNEMKQLIIANNGSIQNFTNIPTQIQQIFKTVWEIAQIWILKASVARGPFIDQTSSVNLFMDKPNNQKLYSAHIYGWKNGLKTGMYYL